MFFNTEQEIKDNEELQKLGKYEHTKVMLYGEQGIGDEVIVCGTDMPYEDIIYDRAYLMISELEKRFDLKIDKTNFSTELRDKALELLEDYGIRFIDMYDEY